MSLTNSQLAVLSTELKTDPIAMGYNLTETLFNLRKLNRGKQNVGLESVPRSITVFLFLKHVVPADIATLSESGKLYLTALLSQPLDTDINNLMSKAYTFLPANSATETKLSGLTRRLSRAEVLFGEGTSITKADFIKAREL